MNWSREQAVGAMPNGTRVEKINSPPGEPHRDGDQATVISSVGPVPWQGYMVYGYFVEWDDLPGLYVFISGDRIRSLLCH